MQWLREAWNRTVSCRVGDGIALLIMAVSFAYIFQFLLAKMVNSDGDRVTERGEQIFMLRKVRRYSDLQKHLSMTHFLEQDKVY